MTGKQVDSLDRATSEIDEAVPMINHATSSRKVSSQRPSPVIRPAGEANHEIKPAQFNIGIVQVKHCKSPAKGRPYAELRYKDPLTGLDVKRRVRGFELAEIKKIAHELNIKAQIGKGHLASQPQAPGIENGLIEAISMTNTTDGVKRERIRLASRFVIWLAESYPAVRTWDELRPVMVRRFVTSLEQDGRAYDTVRLALAPVKLAWRVMSENWPELVRPMPRIKLTSPPRREIVCLEAAELAILLDWLKVHAPDLWPMACLQGLCGLRMLEAAALRVQDVDLKAGTVTVTDTGHHRPKTRDSYRTIPVCDEVIEALKTAITNQKIRPATGELFTNRTGGLWEPVILTQRWRLARRKAAAKPEGVKRKGSEKTRTRNPHGLDMPRLAEIPARKLRAAFATMAGRLGAQDRLVKAYMGHSGGDMLGEHYRRIDLDELRLVSGLMNNWRTPSARKETGNIPLSDASED